MSDQDFLKQRDRFSQDLTGFSGVPSINIGQRPIYRPAVKPDREFRPSQDICRAMAEGRRK
jgi:hypothetical protein